MTKVTKGSCEKGTFALGFFWGGHPVVPEYINPAPGYRLQATGYRVVWCVMNVTNNDILYFITSLRRRKEDRLNLLLKLMTANLLRNVNNCLARLTPCRTYRLADT